MNINKGIFQENIWWLQGPAWKQDHYDMVIPRDLYRLAQEDAFIVDCKYGRNIDFLPYQYKELIYYGLECFAAYSSLSLSYRNDKSDYLICNAQKNVVIKEKQLIEVLKGLEIVYESIVQRI